MYIEITNRIAGTAHLYEYIGKQGRRAVVPTYFATLGNWQAPQEPPYQFAVTRDVAGVVFGKTTSRYDVGGECPPSRNCHPYHGRLVDARGNGRSLLLYDEQSPDQNTLTGDGMVERSFIMVHGGPASSLGCMSIAGGNRGYRQWLRALEYFGCTLDTRFLVSLAPRPRSHHDAHLSRTRCG